MATLGIEQITENAIRAVARDCGRCRSSAAMSRAMSRMCPNRIAEHTKMLDGLEDVMTRLLTDQARVAIRPTKRGC